MSRREGTSPGKSQTAFAESQEPLGIQQTVSAESLGPDASPQSMPLTASDQCLVAFAEANQGKRPTPLDPFAHAGLPCGRLALGQLRVKDSSAPLLISGSQSISGTASRISRDEAHE